jgi:uncharacterized protein with von Willebrand factor type A (vWA) domain
MSGDLIAHLAAFARRLRGRGVGVGLSEEVDGAAALALVDLLDQEEVRSALRTALKVRRSDWGVFDELFSAFWLGDMAALPGSPPARPSVPLLPRATVGPEAGRAAPGARKRGEQKATARTCCCAEPFDQHGRDYRQRRPAPTAQAATRPSRRLALTRARAWIAAQLPRRERAESSAACPSRPGGGGTRGAGA